VEPPNEVDSFRVARAAVIERIRAACARAGRDPQDVALVAVCKTVPAARIRAAVAAGLTLLGENRVQEGVAKRPLVPGAAWHLIGPLQANKVRPAVETFDVIETVDSLALAARVGRIAGELGRAPYPVFLQVNVDEDPAKAGVLPAAAEDELAAIAEVPNLRLLGLMTIGRLAGLPQEAGPTFAALRALSARLRALEPRLGNGLSMGMSDDYEVAIEEGATVVRVGRALFGERAAVGSSGAGANP
jgi:PLP dependent protein